MGKEGTMVEAVVVVVMLDLVGVVEVMLGSLVVVESSMSVAETLMELEMLDEEMHNG